jgi:hypothetical protein
MPRRLGSESAKNVASSVSDSAPIGSVYGYSPCGAPRRRDGHISGLNELKSHGIERAAAQCRRSTSFVPAQGADVTLPRYR